MREVRALVQLSSYSAANSAIFFFLNGSSTLALRSLYLDGLSPGVSFTRVISSSMASMKA
eukprot:CAMPEP_0182569984 /NCGR_PEP_ID=MMETSP1324-20130603/10442_1 /TAXON_ID=236786 /ORGANISM="Florenciella sp., Strain RCC1587" /LENGTH=59 /DNA_ID=CAMNT_0024784319 /DNA_START=101 /DNA_END=280 /DNA_ORIENTATION=-